MTTAPSGGNTLVSWSAVSGATGYRVFRRRDAFPNFDLVATVGASALSWLADNPWSGSAGVPPAQFAVSTLMGANESAFSVIVSNNDQDGDGLSDAEETALGTNPTVVDTDGDGLSDWLDVQIGTNPLNADTDGDGLSDGAEYRVGSDPLRADVTTGPAPEISAISPSSVQAGQDVVLTIDGAGFFDTVSVVRVAGVAVATTYINGSQLRATAPAAMLCSPGPCPITVFNPSPGGGVSNSVSLDVLPAPFIIAGLTGLPNNGGWLSVRRDLINGLALETWRRVPWAAYNASGGGVRVAAGNVDADAFDEIVVGLTTGGQGWIAVLDDAPHAYAVLGWMQVPWSAYNANNGEVYPAVGDIDGDGKGEIIAGLGSGGAGWFAIFQGAGANFAFASWQRVNWAAYNGGSDGSTHPAVSDVDNDGSPDIVVGLGAGSQGWIEIKNGSSGGFGTKTWIQVSWPAYNAGNGITYPAAHGELIAIGLGQGGRGWIETRGGGSTNYAHANWLQVSWPAYNNANGETHPALGNLNTDSGPELVVGLSGFAGNGGWFEVINPVSGVSLGWKNVDWAAFTSAGGGLWPALGRVK